MHPAWRHAENPMTKSMLALAMFTTCLGALTAHTANAAVFRDTSAGGACHAANGAAAAKFSYGNNLLTNNATNDQFVVCHFQMDDDQAVTLTTPLYVSAAISPGATGGTVTCLAQMGYFLSGQSLVSASISRSATLPAGEHTTLAWNAVSWGRTEPYQTLTLNCRLPPGFRMGLIQWQQ
jgi:hypothetical protein